MSAGPDKKLTFAEYSAIESVNWSTLKEMRRSPLHYRHRCEVPREDTPRLALGRAAHTAVFEPDRFMIEYACFKGERRAGKEWEAFKAANGDRTILKLDEYTECLRIRDAVRANPLAMQYLKAGVCESPVLWTDPTTGLACKARRDWISTSKPAIVDLKTTKDIAPNRFASTCAALGYHAQGAWYQAGHAYATGETLPFVIVAVEYDAPYDVAVYLLDDDAMYAGEQEWQRLLASVADCRKRGEWPGRFDSEQTLRLPRWVVGDDEDDVTGLGLVINGQDAA